MNAYPTVNVRRGNYRVPHHNYKVRRGYKSEKGNPRVGIAVNYLRFKYRLPMNAIAWILGVSTRTVHRKICFSRLAGGKGFDAASRRTNCRKRQSVPEEYTILGFKFKRKVHTRLPEVKIVNSKGQVLGLKRLAFRFALYFIGALGTVEEAAGDEPP